MCESTILRTFKSQLYLSVFSLIWLFENQRTSQQTFILVKTYWRRLQDVFNVTFFCLPRRLEDVLKRSWRHNCKTSWKRSSIRLQDILLRSITNIRLGRRKVLRWRRLGEQEMFAGIKFSPTSSRAFITSFMLYLTTNGVFLSA